MLLFIAEDGLFGVVVAWDAERGERRWEFASREPRGARGRDDLDGVSMIIVESYYTEKPVEVLGCCGDGGRWELELVVGRVVQRTCGRVSYLSSSFPYRFSSALPIRILIPDITYG